MSLDARIARIATRQHGVFTRAQALAAGATSRMVDHRLATGRLERVHPGTHVVAGTPRTFRLRVLAACFVSGGVASHRTAGALWELDGVEEGIVEVSGADRVRIDGLRAHQVRDFAPRDLTRVGPIPVTSVPRTIIDLAADLDHDALEAALDDALRRRLLTVARRSAVYHRVTHRGRRGIGVVRELLNARPSASAVPDSPLEAKMQRLIARAGLPEPVLHYRVGDGERAIAVIDLAYPDQRIAIELDGYRYHHGRQRWQRDLQRANVLILLGWRVLRFTDEDLRRRPAEVVAAVACALDMNSRHSSTHRVDR